MHEGEQVPKFQSKRSNLPTILIYDYALPQLLQEAENDLTSLKDFIYAKSLVANKKKGIKLKKKDF